MTLFYVHTSKKTFVYGSTTCYSFHYLCADMLMSVGHTTVRDTTLNNVGLPTPKYCLLDVLIQIMDFVFDTPAICFSCDVFHNKLALSDK